MQHLYILLLLQHSLPPFITVSSSFYEVNTTYKLRDAHIYMWSMLVEREQEQRRGAREDISFYQFCFILHFLPTPVHNHLIFIFLQHQELSQDPRILAHVMKVNTQPPMKMTNHAPHFHIQTTPPLAAFTQLTIKVHSTPTPLVIPDQYHIAFLIPILFSILIPFPLPDPQLHH